MFAAILALSGHAGSAMATPSFEDAGGSFLPAVRYPVGTNPFAVASGDFNGDGKVDLAVGNWDGDSVSILLGDGAGAYAPKVDYGVGDGAQTVAVADFNGDLKLDLAVANIWSHDVSVLLGTGTGTFAASVEYPAGTNPRSVAVGDFNADGKADLVVPNGSSGNISVLLGVGNGTFAAATHFQVGGGAISVAIGDFNGDGKPDLAVANQQSNSVSILLGTGAGDFGAADNIAVGTDPTSVASGDFNADGKLDLAVTNLESGNVSLLSGTGSGTFSADAPLSAGVRPIFVAAGDLDGDGRPELAVANESDDTVSILLGSSSGEFGEAVRVPTASQISRSIGIADLNGDGRLDLVVVNAGGNDVSILLPEVLPVIDIRPIGNTDATSSYALRKSTLWIDRQSLFGGWPFAHAGYADFNKDGRVDFIRTFSDNTDTRRPVQFMRNDGGGNFSDQTAATVTNTQPGVLVTRKILIGDFNGDGWPEAFILGHGLDGFTPAPGEYPQLFLSNGNGTVRYVPGLEPYPAFNHGGASGDIDNNGTVDILVPDVRTPDFPVPGPPRPYFLVNDGQGQFTRNFNRLPAEFVTNVNYAIELIDIDQDGFIDILTGGDEVAGIGTTIYWGNASGYYRASNKSVLPRVVDWEIVWDFAAEDLDGDGLRDLVVYRVRSDAANGRNFQILRQTAPRVFADETASRISMDRTDPGTDFIRVQDLNGDGHLDIFIDDKDFVSKGDYAWLNNGQGVFAPYTGGVTALAPAPALSITDVSVTEGASGGKLIIFTIGLSSISPTAVTYDIATVNGTATAGSDYVARALPGQSIAAGSTSATFAVTVNGDTALEGDEAFRVRVSAVVGATVADGEAIGRILDDDSALPSLSIGDVSVAEGDTGTQTATFAVTLSSPAPAPVGFAIATADGTALAGSDYVARSLPGQSIATGASSATFAVTINGDTAVEADETFSVAVTAVTGATVADGTATGTIADDDGAPLPPLLARADRVVLRENGAPIDISVLANDVATASRLGTGTLTIVAAPARGTASVQTSGTTTAADDRIRYTPSANSGGVDALTYRLCESGAGRCSDGRLQLVVRPLTDVALMPATNAGFVDLPASGLRALPAAEFTATPAVAPVVVTAAMATDPTPLSPFDGPAGHALVLRTLPAAGDAQPREWQVLVDGRGSAADIDVHLGVDANGDGQASQGELQCSAAMDTPVERCELVATHPGAGTLRYWIVAHNRGTVAQDARLEIFEVPVVAGDTRRVATGPGILAAAEAFPLRLSWNDPEQAPGEARVGYVRLLSAGVETGRFPVRIDRDGGVVAAMVLTPGRPQPLRLAAGAAHDRLFVDVPAGASALTVSTASPQNVDLYLARVATGSSPGIDAAPARALAQASAVGATGNESITLSGSQLPPGRWYVTPVNTTAVPADLTVNASVTGIAPAVRPGSYFNPARGGHGVFLYPAADQWTGLWYTYFQDGTPTWYYLQGLKPGANGVWSSAVHRAAWQGSGNRLSEVGRVTLTPTGADAFSWSYEIDGETGSEPMVSLGRGCPMLDGAALDASSTWFNPDRAGTGYSTQLWPDYEYYAAFVYDARGVPRFLTAENTRFGGADATIDLEQLTGFCPLCNRAGSPARSTIGVMTRTLGAGTIQNITLDGLYTGGVPGVWTADEAVQTLGGPGTTQGCVP